jgi:hypothetical protein
MEIDLPYLLRATIAMAVLHSISAIIQERENVPFQQALFDLFNACKFSHSSYHF